MSDRRGLERFVAAQNRETRDGSSAYGRALAELRGGLKTSHWMWFIFPQVAGLGRSPTAKKFAIRSIEEAGLYLAHPVLGPRLLETTGALIDHGGDDAEDIFGGIDAVKLRSSMTLFATAATEEPVFRRDLDKFHLGEPDGRTLEILKGESR